MRGRWTIFMIVALVLVVTFTIKYASSQVGQEAPQPPVKLSEFPHGTGDIPPPMDLSHLTGQELPERFKGLPPPPAQFDWRTLGKVTPVYGPGQGTCGSCYAFAALANIESKMLIDGAGTFDFSENNAKECNWYETYLDTGSCSGGNYFKMASWFSKKGTVMETCDPYVAADVDCKSTCPYKKTLLDWRLICWDVPADSVLKTYIQKEGPVKASLYAGDTTNDPAWFWEFQKYNGSYVLYYDTTCAFSENHAVCIVGWDDNLSHAGGKGAWIVKNSWGTNWGGTCGYGTERGYFTIAYKSARIGTRSSYLNQWQDYDSKETLLFYDEGGWTAEKACGNTTYWGMCKFEPYSDCKLTRVEFWTSDKTTDIDVFIYDTYGLDSLSNLLTQELDISYNEAGYHSVLLSSPPSVTAGNNVYVAVKFTNSTYNKPICVDYLDPIMSATTYTSSNGIRWDELKYADVAIRLRTKAVGVPVVLAGFQASGGQGSIALNWTTVSEVNCHRWEVYRSETEDGQYLKLGELSGHGSTDHTHSYRWIDRQLTPGATYFYKLNQVNFDGSSWWSQVVSATVGAAIPETYTLHQNYPNPFNPNTEISYAIPTKTHVTVKIYNLLGQEVASLVDEVKEAGHHTVSWNAADNASGVYFYRLQTDDFSATKKMVFLK